MTYAINGPFEWDTVKADSNYKKHNVDFYEAMTIWADKNGIDILNLDDSRSEERWIRVGYSIKTRLLIAVYNERNGGEQIRIISARRATKKEQQQYDLNIHMVIA